MLWAKVTVELWWVSWIAVVWFVFALGRTYEVWATSRKDRVVPYEARTRLFLHCLVHFHRAWSYECEGKLEAVGCRDCKSVFWGNAPGVVRTMGWVK